MILIPWIHAFFLSSLRLPRTSNTLQAERNDDMDKNDECMIAYLAEVWFNNSLNELKILLYSLGFIFLSGVWVFKFLSRSRVQLCVLIFFIAFLRHLLLHLPFTLIKSILFCFRVLFLFFHTIFIRTPKRRNSAKKKKTPARTQTPSKPSCTPWKRTPKLPKTRNAWPALLR